MADDLQADYGSDAIRHILGWDETPVDHEKQAQLWAELNVLAAMIPPRTKAERIAQLKALRDGPPTDA